MLKLKETKNIKELEKVLFNKEIYDTITSDNNAFMEIPVTSEYKYIGGFVDNEIIAVMVYHKYKDGNECHVQVLPEFREEYAKEFGEQVLKFKGHSPLYAEIPLLYKNVLDYALKNKFAVIEIKNDGYVKGGVEYPTFVLKYEE